MPRKGFCRFEHDAYETREHGHGRDEYRSYLILRQTSGIRNADAWANLTTIGMCYSERTVNGVTSEEVRYFIGSKKAKARTYAQALRKHWGIENSLHWQLDVTFDEDDNRVTKRNGAENLALLRRLTLSLLKAHPEKLSIAKKRFAAALDTQSLEEVLSGDGVLGNLWCVGTGPQAESLGTSSGGDRRDWWCAHRWVGRGALLGRSAVH